MAIKKLIKLFWICDPKNEKPSVSLTLMLCSFLGLVVLSVLQTMGKVDGLGAFQELFYATSALYFGRRLNINGKDFAADKGEDSE